MENRVIEIVGSALNVKVDINSSQDNTKGWDSLSYLLIMTEIEREFPGVISDAGFQGFGSVKSIIHSIESNINLI
jgi:acyl carrier protein